MSRGMKMFLRCSVKNTILLCFIVLMFIISSLLTFTPTEKRSLGSNISVISNATLTSKRKDKDILSVTEKIPKQSIQNKATKYNYPYKYVNTPTNICNSANKSSDPFLLIIVKSNVRNLDNRMAIRSTWGNISDPTVNVIFLLGYSPFLQDFINTEHSLFKDIVQEDFLDNYNNNTLKTVMGFNWSVTYCQKTKFFFFVDDDYLVNVRFLLNDLRKLKRNTSIFTGCVWYKAKPNRNKRSKWFVSKLEYPGEYWPPYATGGSIVLSYDYATKIKNGFNTIKPLYIDDVYLGIVAKKLKIPLTNDGRFHPYYNLGQIHKLYSIHNFLSPRKLMEDWNKLKSKLKV